MNNSKVWYVTGASQGLGLTLVKKLLANGHKVAAASRNCQRLKQAVGIIDTDRFLPLAVNMNNSDCIDESIRQTVETFGRIDVLVNNAGYGMSATAEETTEEDIIKIFEVNVFATINVIKSVLPIMRNQHSGHIINMGSVAGFAGAPGWSVYSATKAAVAAFSEVLALDVKEFGIKVTIAEPSNFRTSFLSGKSLSYTETKIDGYTTVKETATRYLATNGQQPGDPEKLSDILIALADSNEPPLHLFLGKDAYTRASTKMQSMTAELEKWKQETISADFQ